MPAVVHDARHEVFAAAGHGLDSFLGGLVFARAARQGRWRRMHLRGRRGRGEAGRWERRRVIRVGRVAGTVIAVVPVAGAARISGRAQGFAGEDVRDGREAVVCLRCGDVVDVGCLGEAGGRVDDLAGQGLCVLAQAGKGVV